MSFECAVNEQIRNKEVRLVDETGGQVGVISTQEALARARRVGLDLVVVAGKSNPPVCKILDYGKFKYDQSKREKDAARKSRESRTDLKEIQLRPVTDQHDIEIKAKRAAGFLADGDKVKVVVRFKGREVHHSEMGRKVIDAFLTSLGDHKLEKPVTMNDRQMFTILAQAPQVPVKKV